MYSQKNNTYKEVFFSDNNEAWIFIRDIYGTPGMASNLTNLGNWLEDGTIANEEELRNDWLSIPDQK
jgi:hypothetical protein